MVKRPNTSNAAKGGRAGRWVRDIPTEGILEQRARVQSAPRTASSGGGGGSARKRAYSRDYEKRMMECTTTYSQPQHMATTTSAGDDVRIPPEVFEMTCVASPDGKGIMVKPPLMPMSCVEADQFDFSAISPLAPPVKRINYSRDGPRPRSNHFRRPKTAGHTRSR